MINFKGKTIHAAIFDMDGTMFDTECLRFRTIREASEELTGRPISDEILMGSLGLSAKKAEALAKEHNGQDYPYAEIRRRADELELAYVRTHGVPIKTGLLEVLERLRKSGLAMAVATSSRRAIAEEYLINANVLKYFDITVCGDEVRQGKPHPEIFLRAAHGLSCTPDTCLMFEDSENGLLAAEQSGGQAILIKDIKWPRPEIRSRAFQGYERMQDFLADLIECTPLMSAPKLTENFPLTLNQETVGIHGFGAIGGGYLTQIFSHWDGYTRPREIIGVTGDPMLLKLVNAFGKFSVRYYAASFDQTIENVRLIDMQDQDAISDMYSVSEIVGMSLPEHAIRQQADAIARGLIRRFEQRGRPLTILVVLNKIAGARFVRRHVEAALARMVPAETAQQIMQKTHFSETVVNRIVSRLTKEALLRQVRIKFKIFEQNVAQAREQADAVAPAAYVAPATDIDRIAAKLRQASQLANALGQLNLILFNSEPDMQLYAERGSPLLERLRQIRTVADITQIQTVKNRLWNGTHAVIAWYASLLGHQTIGQGMSDDRVTALAALLIKTEIEPAMLKEDPELQSILPSFIKTFLARCRASFKDPCDRVGRDPLRKLQRKERILGSIDLAHKFGMPTPMLEYGVALGILYALRSTDSEDREIRLIKELYARAHNVSAVLAYRGNYNGRPYAGLDTQADAELIGRIAAHFNQLLREPQGEHWNWPLTRIEQHPLSAAMHKSMNEPVAPHAVQSEPVDAVQ
ncbi:bifunctional mannitol-1-phosphate dehydrogenase/phosphatase [Oxalicibacterium flavum]|nr:HAD family hydrolase [Oxalicibacterium flavum]